VAVQGVNGIAVAAAAAGTLLLWSGLRGAKVTTAVRQLASGQQPASGALPILTPAGTSPPAGPGGSASLTGAITGNAPFAAGPLETYAEAQLAIRGWGGQFPALNSIVMAESSWNPEARNPSGAYGIAQALGHGTANTAGTKANEYGNFGTSDAVCRAANSGSGTAQIDWMLNYIGQVYGSPNAAWMFHLAHGSY